MTDVLRGFFAKVMRFSVVGAINGLIYAASTVVFVSVVGLPAGRSSVLAYLTVLPFAYVAHRRFTFRSQGSHRREAWRFIIAFVSGLLLSAGLMYVAVSMLNLHYVIGIAAGILCVPLITLFVLDRWVFQMQSLDLGRETRKRSGY